MKDRQDLKENDVILPKDYKETLGQLKERIKSAQTRASRAVNNELIQLYWDIGKTIVEKQETDPDSWGKSVIEKLALDLSRSCLLYTSDAADE